MLHYVDEKAHLSKEDFKVVMDMFELIFGKKLEKVLPPPRVLPTINEFSLALAKKWENFVAPANLLDLDRSTEVSLRVRGLNDAELA